MSKVIVVPVNEDNYSYILICAHTNEVAFVDPAEPEKVLAAAEKNGIHKAQIRTVLTTHKHLDHSGGNEWMAENFPGIVIIGGAGDAVPAVTREVGQGDVVQVGKLEVQCLLVPCHTKGHIMFFVPPGEETPPVLFSGDTLFNGGCGRFFEGTAKDMYNALCVQAAALPPNTLVYSGHEYTVNNYRFCVHVEPENKAMADTYERAQRTRAAGHPTVPTTMADELEFNVFLRVDNPKVKEFTGKEDPVDVMMALREAKNGFGLGGGPKL
jgi:hydroxyacylglutathione hydrolase